MKRTNLGLKRALTAALVAALSVSLLAGCGGSDTAATTMRLLKFAGDVTMTEGGKDAALLENMSLHSGNVIKTGTDAEADISLDDTKFAGLDPKSEAEFFQDGKKLDIRFNAGGLYFYTTEKLTDEEELNVETSTMVVGIRGTSGHFDIDETTGETTLYLTSGEVEVKALDPETGEVVGTATVSAGQKASTNVSASSDGAAGIEVQDFEPEELPTAFLKKMDNNAGLKTEVVEKGGYDEGLISAMAAVAAGGGSVSEIAAAASDYRATNETAAADASDAAKTADAEDGQLTADADAGANTNTRSRATTTNTTTQTATADAEADTTADAGETASDASDDTSSNDKDDNNSSSSRRRTTTEDNDDNSSSSSASSSQTADTTASDFAALQAYMAMISANSGGSTNGNAGDSASSGQGSTAQPATPQKTPNEIGEISYKDDSGVKAFVGISQTNETEPAQYYLKLTKDSVDWIANDISFTENGNQSNTYTNTTKGVTFEWKNESGAETETISYVSGIQEIYYDKEFWGLSGFGQEVQKENGSYTFATGATATKQTEDGLPSSDTANVVYIVTGDVGKWEGYFDIKPE